MSGMYNSINADEKHDGDIRKILGSSGDPLLTPYTPLKGLKVKFWICACGVCTIGLRPRGGSTHFIWQKNMFCLYKRTIPGLTLSIGSGPQLGPLRPSERPKN